MPRLVDTSWWIELLRDTGRPDIKERLGQLILDKQAAWCDIVLVELFNGGSEQDVVKIDALRPFVTSVAIDSDVWRIAKELARLARSKGKTFPVPDILIVACATRHRMLVESRDNHFKDLLVFASSCSPPRTP